jgi:DNA-binding transcriptional ArsR family regulator
MRDAVQKFKALGDGTRLRIMHILVVVGPMTVKDLEDILHVPQTNISRHLAVLRNADLVLNRRQGNYMVYMISRGCSERLKREIIEIGERSIELKSDRQRALMYHQKQQEED